jgi:hypothetical protein
LVDVVDVVFDSMGGNVERFFDIRITQSVKNKLDDFLFSIGDFVHDTKIFQVSVLIGSAEVFIEMFFKE